jgi:hypothetical protein
VSGSFVVATLEPYALGPGEGRVIDLGDFAVTVKASESETGGVVSVLENEEPPGFGPPIHVHHDCAEAFYVLAGEYIIPKGVRHGFRVGNVPSRKLNFYFPASMVAYFDELAVALQRDSVSESELAGIADAHQMEIVGPPSEQYV